MSASQIGGVASAAGAVASVIPGGQVIGGILTGLGGIASIFGGAASDDAEQRAINKQYKSDIANWKYNQNEIDRRHEFDLETLKILKLNTLNEIGREEAILRSQYNFDEKTRLFEYNVRKAAWQQSEENYKQQLMFNNMAAAEAYESEQRVLNEVLIAQAFQREDAMISGIQSRGKAQVGQAGGSRQRLQALSIAETGRTLARLDESLRSASTQAKANIRSIGTQKYGADLRANAARIIKPQAGVATPKPIKLNVPVFQDPYKPGDLPKPKKGVAQGGGLMAGLTSGLPQIGMAAADIYSGIKNSSRKTS